MAFQSVPNTAMLTWVLDGTGGSELQGAEAQFSVYIRDESGADPWTLVSLSALNLYGVTWWSAGKNGGSPMRANFVDAWTLTEVIARDLVNENGPVVPSSPGSAGTITGDPVSAALATWTKFTGESGALPKDGGVFTPSGYQLVEDGDLWDANHAASVEQVWEDFRADLTDPLAGGDADWEHVIVSRSQSLNDDVKNARAALRAAIAATRRATAVTNPVTAVATRRLVAIQRDRRVGEGG